MKLPKTRIKFPAILFFALQLSTSVTPAVEPIPLRAGPVTMVFDADNVFLRYLRVGPYEVLRGINAPVRNQTWATVAPQVSNLQIENRDAGFVVTFDVRCLEGDVDFRWKGSISGNAQGVVEFTFDGVSDSTFQRNRIGFCVLHAPSAAGQPWVIETVDGKVSQGQFPKYISPHQPAKNLRAISHEVAPGVHARVEFEGDVFEMEDQRNWTDASFKTYCTPLELPYPVEIAQGTKVSQKISIRLTGDLPNVARSDAESVVLTLGEKQTELPRLGLQVSSETQQLTTTERKRLEALHLDHLRVNLALSDESFLTDLRRATQQANSLGVSLQVGLILGDSPQFTALMSEIKNLQPPVSYWLVTGGDPTHFQAARQQLAPNLDGAQLGVTRITNFVDLNRARPTDRAVEAVGFAISPQIHAFDNASMVETLPIQADVVSSARQFVGDRPLVIGPITLRPQLVNGEPPPGGPPAGRLPTYVDARQVTEFAAAWTLGSVKYIAEAGANSATYFETVGWNGIMDTENVASRPAAFPSRPGAVFPVYHVLKDIGEFAGGRVQQFDSTDNLSVVGLAIRKEGRMRLLIANLTDQRQSVALRGMGDPVEVFLLADERSNGTQLGDQVSPELPLVLPPHAIARIDRVLE